MASLSSMTLEAYTRMKARHPDIAIDTDNGSIVLARVCTRCEGEGHRLGFGCSECGGSDLNHKIGTGYIATDAGLAILRLMELRK